MKYKVAKCLCFLTAASFLLTGCKKEASVSAENQSISSFAEVSEEYTDYHIENLPTDGYVNLGQYTGLTVSALRDTMSDEEINNYLVETLGDLSYEEVDRAAELGDYVCYSSVAVANGEPYEELSEDNAFIFLQEDTVIDSFDWLIESLIGKQTGDRLSKTVELSEDNPFDVVGEIEYTIDVLGVYKEIEIPNPLTDDWVQRSLLKDEFSSAQELIDSARGVMEEESQNEYENRVLTAIVDKIYETTQIVPPEQYIQDMSNNIMDEISTYAEEDGSTISAELISCYGIIPNDEENVEASVREYVSQVVCPEKLLIAAIAKKENLYPTDDEINIMISELASRYGLSSEEYLQFYPESTPDIRDNAITVKVLQFLMDNNSATE